MLKLPGFFLLCSLSAAVAHAAELPELEQSTVGGFSSQEGVPSRDDPTADGWQSEALMRAMGAQLRLVVDYLKHPDSAEAAKQLGGVTADGFTTTPLRPRRLSTRFRDNAMHVRGPVAAPGAAPASGVPLQTALDELLSPLGQATDMRAKIKDVGIDLSGPDPRSSHLLSVSGTVADATVEIHSRWELAWSPDHEGSPLLARIRVASYEETSTALEQRPTLFAECTRSVLGRNRSYEDQLLRGPDHWLTRLEAAMGTDIMGHSGLAVGDVNGDGLEDLYVPQHGGLPNRLYVQTLDGSATDRSAASGVDWLDRSLSALVIDLDNDGDQDLVVGSTAGLLLHENDGSGRFELRASLVDARYAYSLAAADFDRDGDLDIYATRYSPIRDDPVDESVDVPKPVPYHDARNGSPNVLVRNEGSWEFTNATGETGLDVDNRRWSFAAAWEDYDDDGDQDLYVANDFGPNALFRNDNGRFQNVAPEAGVEDRASGMSAAWGDPNRDGVMDVYVGNMYSSAGNRITTQPMFRTDSGSEMRETMRRMAKGNSLFLGDASGRFREVAEEQGAAMGRWAWSSVYADVNNDGWEDIVVANGFLTAEKADDL